MSDSHALWGEDQALIDAGVDAMVGQHPERGAPYLEQTVYAVLTAFRAVETPTLTIRTLAADDRIGFASIAAHASKGTQACVDELLHRMGSHSDLVVIAVPPGKGDAMRAELGSQIVGEAVRDAG